MQAAKLKTGDEIRIISPANSLGIIAKDQLEHATKLLEKLGFTVSFAGHAYEQDIFGSSSVASRVEDIHNAFSDPQVKGILTTLGGHNSNQLLRELDYDLIAANPKRLCGYSDITVLSNAIYAKTGLLTYSGPHFSTFGMKLGNEYTVECFTKMMMGHEAVTVEPSEHWSDDAWFIDQENRVFEKIAALITLTKAKRRVRCSAEICVRSACCTERSTCRIWKARFCFWRMISRSILKCLTVIWYR